MACGRDIFPTRCLYEYRRLDMLMMTSMSPDGAVETKREGERQGGRERGERQRGNLSVMAFINPSPTVVERKTTTRAHTDHDASITDEDGGTIWSPQAAEGLFRFASSVAREYETDDVATLKYDTLSIDETGNTNVGEVVCRENVDSLEVFEHIRDIRDPEHPYTLEQLSVVREEHIFVEDCKDKSQRMRGTVRVQFTPTVMHCSMATLIGLSIRVKLMRVLHPRFKVHFSLWCNT